MRKKVLEKRLARLLKKKDALKERGLASNDASEVRSITVQLEELEEDIEEVQEEIEALEEENGTENRSNGTETHGNMPEYTISNPIIRGSYGMAMHTDEQRGNTSPFASMEYRTAFKEYVQKGVPIPTEFTQRAGGDSGITVSADIGAVIPETIMSEIIKNVSKTYGQLYSKVRKLNIQGGVKFPISDLKANFKWISESKTSERQKAGDIKKYIEFSYNIGEIRVAQSLLSSIVSLPVFEQEIIRIMTEAYVEAMDKGIVSGSGTGQMQGILTDTRVTENTENIIEMTEEQFGDWTTWRKELFAKIPISKRGKGEFIFTAGTIESNLLTMKDANNRPVFREATELEVGESASFGKFYGREVTMVEPDVLHDFTTANSGDVVGIYWIPEDYAINTNLTFGMKRYFDEDNNVWINKGLTIVDGKLLDASGVYLVKKK